VPREPKAEKANPKPQLSDKVQSERFKETARELGVDESGKTFEKTFSSITKKPPDD
jgi:hypothetical protein